MKYIIIFCAALSGILLFLLASASANTALFSRHYPLLLILNASLVLGLLVLIAFQLKALWGKLRAKVFGSRLTLRLLVIFILMAWVPGTLVYAVSVQFLSKSIESWFDVRVDNALEGGLKLGRSALDHLLAELKSKARFIAGELSGQPTAMQAASLGRLREQTSVSELTLLNLNGMVVANASKEVGKIFPDLPSTLLLNRARQNRIYATIEGTDKDKSLKMRVLVPVMSSSLIEEERILQVIQPVPLELAQSAEAVEGVYQDYQTLSLSRTGLKKIYAITLTLTLLLALFLAIALAFFLSNWLSAPLAILEEGTKAVAQGDFSPLRSLSPLSRSASNDELGVLTQSFNTMTQQLEEARGIAEQNRIQIDSARIYLESILANISAGVLAFDPELNLRAANYRADVILKQNFSLLQGKKITSWLQLKQFAQAVLNGFSQHPDQDWEQQIEMGSEQVLLIRGSHLPTAGGGGCVVVFDDVSHLIHAQRAAAWGEVAQRLAHEIKNPLTPIQLSAERLQQKLADKLEFRDKEILNRAIETIVNQVAAMKSMVNDFRDYAHKPAAVLKNIDLNSVVTEVLALYEGSSIQIRTQLDSKLPLIQGDAIQLRQVIHNLLQNAQDALVQAPNACVTVITELIKNQVRLNIMDNGNGFPENIMSRVFEPYVTTKTKGTGLGLAIVKKIIDEHHGTIHAENIEPCGACVSISFPVEVASATFNFYPLSLGERG